MTFWRFTNRIIIIIIIIIDEWWKRIKACESDKDILNICVPDFHLKACLVSSNVLYTQSSNVAVWYGIRV